eukprot:gb/GFBE01015574.1/.p1 GENE.gb/GFBE01015574.1/~~gb/GFBE01015574.1/.p1  ORF type:complete len:594 (+),score=93.24 gb/GFBE01015574.1/:1-1782(+)
MPSRHASDHSEESDQDVEDVPSYTQKSGRRSSIISDLLGGPVIPDAELMKKKVREALEKPTYSVFDYYHTSGFFQKVARSSAFENITLLVISANAVWIAVDTDWNTKESLLEADLPFQIMENAFCAFFSVEWFIRFMAFKNKLNGCRDYWFVFDTTLVSLMVGETWVLTAWSMASGSEGGNSSLGDASVLRLFRLLRLSRMARMLRSMPELMILIKGMFAAARSVMFVMILLIIMMYIFSIAFTQLAEGTIMGAFYFPSVEHSMYSLLIYGTFLDNLAQFCDEVGNESGVCLMLVFIFLLLAACTVLNMLIGVLCEVVSAVAAVEKEMMMVEFVTSKLQTLLFSLDQDNDGHISKAEFMNILELPEAAKALEEVGVDPISIVDFTDIIFGSSDDPTEALSFGKFMEVLLNLRGGNGATIKDVVSLRGFITEKIGEVEQNVLRNVPLKVQDAQPLSPKPSSSTACHGSRSPSPGHGRPRAGSAERKVHRIASHQVQVGSRFDSGAIKELQTRTGRLENTMGILLDEIRQLSDCLPEGQHQLVPLPGQVPCQVKQLPRAQVIPQNYTENGGRFHEYSPNRKNGSSQDLKRNQKAW